VITSDFPRIPHLPGSHVDVDDLVFDDDDAKAFLSRPAVVFEKLDGLNVMITSAGRGRLTASLKGEWRGADGGAVERAIAIWLRQREHRLAPVLRGASCLYGEWLWHTVSVSYDALDDVFVAFSMRGPRGQLLPYAALRDSLEGSGVAVAKPLCHRRLRDVASVRALAQRSRHRRGEGEGVILDLDGGDEQRRFAKWVNASYAHPQKGQLNGQKNRRRSFS
jgi:hypothetical protein